MIILGKISLRLYISLLIVSEFKEEATLKELIKVFHWMSRIIEESETVVQIVSGYGGSKSTIIKVLRALGLHLDKMTRPQMSLVIILQKCHWYHRYCNYAKTSFYHSA